MKKILALTILPLALASCNMFGVPNGDVSGNILGKQPVDGPVRLSLSEISTAGIGATVLDQFNFGTFNPEKRAYVVSLKQNPADGIYELFAYVDANKDDHYNSGEKRTQATTTRFIYSKDGNSTLNVRPGWNLYDGLTFKKNGVPFSGYDLNW